MRSALQVVVASAIVCSVGSAQYQKLAGAKRTASIDRGRYLVNNVAQCTQCHTPRNERGELILSRLLEGAPILVSKPSMITSWADFAPRIAGLPQYSQEQIITLLTTGIGREGKPLRSPMPTYKMSQQDAEDVAAYLKQK